MASFRFTTSLEIRFRDLDALGHVNNAVYLTYFEIVRTRYWKRLFGLPPAQDWGFVMVRTECNYRSPGPPGGDHYHRRPNLSPEELQLHLRVPPD